MILIAIVSTLKRRAQNDFKGGHYEASLIIQAVSSERFLPRPGPAFGSASLFQRHG